MDDLDDLAASISEANTVVALTGAGLSAPSGVPTFRGEDGVWDRFDEGQFAYGRFQRDPAGFWADRLELQREMYGDEPPDPNAAHLALSELGVRGYLDAIVTQNVDGLHERANRAVYDESGGADGDGAVLIEIHGNARRVVCTDCGHRQDSAPVFERAAAGELPPECDCGGVLKPDVVLFGGQLPAAALQQARSLARESDVFLAIGSSLVVEPAASLPRVAVDAGATLAVVNLAETPLDGRAAKVIREDVADSLPALVSALRKR